VLSQSNTPTTPPVVAIGFDELYEANAAFVWRSLRRLGVRPGDVADQTQEVFMLAHKKLETFTGGSEKAWLFAIALRISSDYRKRAYIRREVTTEAVPDAPMEEGITGEIDQARARRLLDSVLDTLEEDKRVVFILHELEQVSIPEIAQFLNCPAQTLYSRLHVAREKVRFAIHHLRRPERGTR
jgi:RNA polymerase sigma-70 factor, ECF subfamily